MAPSRPPVRLAAAGARREDAPCGGRCAPPRGERITGRGGPRVDLRDLYGRAGALVVTAGAGMGVDSGLPDLRGDRGSWTAYPRTSARGTRGDRPVAGC